MFQILKQNLSNIPSWRTNRKIVVIESDDWGSIRMPSKQAYDRLLKKGIRVDKSKYDNFDILENKQDLENLFGVLSKYKNHKGNHPIFTFNTVMGNPDFDGIGEDKFEKYHQEHFFDSYKKYWGQNLEKIWKEGISLGLVKPQYHAREHLNTALWMKDLKSNKKDTRVAFEEGFFGLKTNTSSPYQKHYLAAYCVENSEELDLLKKITQDGLSIFENTFGFKSKTLIACNYVWPLEIEPFVFGLGIRSLQGQRGHIVPDPNKRGKTTINRHFTGQKNTIGQIYTIRNVKFEPYENRNLNWVEKSLKEIENAFFWKTPAIISSHRINYVGGMDQKNRDINLIQLDLLLKEILKKRPEVEFLSSDELRDLICNTKTK